MGEGSRVAKSRKEGAEEKDVKKIIERMAATGRGRYSKKESKDIKRPGKFKNLTERQKGTTGMAPEGKMGKLSGSQLAYLRGVVSQKARKGTARARAKTSAQLMLDLHAKQYPKQKKTAKKKTAKATQRKTTKKKTTKRKTAKRKTAKKR